MLRCFLAADVILVVPPTTDVPGNAAAVEDRVFDSVMEFMQWLDDRLMPELAKVGPAAETDSAAAKPTTSTGVPDVQPVRSKIRSVAARHRCTRTSVLAPHGG